MFDEIDLFSNVKEKFVINRKIRLIEMFAGIGSQAKALENLEKSGKLKYGFEHHRVIEFDQNAINSYNAIHQTDFPTMDITKTHAEDLGIEERDKYIYFLTYSFPCQDLSNAGLQKGMTKGSNTRSGLLWEVERILDECNGNLPQLLMMENVPAVIGKKNIKDFQLWRRKLESLGYENYVQILNSKNYGIPQNRQRCFMISILGNYHYDFPKPFPLKLKLKDMLEPKVDESYYLSDSMLKYITADNDKWITPKKALINKNPSNTITCREGLTRAAESTYVDSERERVRPQGTDE